MKMLLKSNKGSGNFPPLQNIIFIQNLGKFAYGDEEICNYLNEINNTSSIKIEHIYINKQSF
jgi:hypothetical protein